MQDNSKKSKKFLKLPRIHKNSQEFPDWFAIFASGRWDEQNKMKSFHASGPVNSE